ncbi:AAL015Wp [Eremothecium gossypii ATCC 10895]|uniref:AAL015Wp n=2 Tax=Eremothecium gossypii TaxID=33169 RepID=Q75EV1_EREGS|nr:AAL015Wp [Eremothecium gossypii ATCC 10895]AAS50351.1 AAL015Wp [Eremothecium gossypii ATCC 10895]AEY94637.1 FAAL015Wp [Eremothecium gossypii FDAG1]
MSVNLYTELENVGTYKVLQLTEELIRAFQSGPVELKAGGDDSEVVLCSADKTWAVRQKNHSNTVILMKEFAPVPAAETQVSARGPVQGEWLGYTQQTCELEPRATAGQVDLSALPIYNGQHVGDGPDVETLVENATCSRAEFYAAWRAAGGCSVGGTACVISPDLLGRTLHLVLATAVADGFDLACVGPEQMWASIARSMAAGAHGATHPYSREVIETVLHRFGRVGSDGVSFELDLSRIARWYGVQALKKFASTEAIMVDEFMIKWRSLFPAYFRCDLDLELLYGEFARPQHERIQYLSRSTLPMDIKDRFQQLFRIQNAWDIREITPFIEELNTRGIGMDNFVLKYARRKKTGKTIVVMPR